MILSEKKQKIYSGFCVGEILRDIMNKWPDFELDKEHFFVVGLNNRLVIQYIDLVSVGTATSADVHPRETFRLAVMRGAVSIIVAHNHPSGDTTPSKDDKAITQRLRDAGEIIGISLNDHLIIGGTSPVYSFKYAGLM